MTNRVGETIRKRLI